MYIYLSRQDCGKVLVGSHGKPDFDAADSFGHVYRSKSIPTL